MWPGRRSPFSGQNDFLRGTRCETGGIGGHAATGCAGGYDCRPLRIRVTLDKGTRHHERANEAHRSQRGTGPRARCHCGRNAWDPSDAQGKWFAGLLCSSRDTSFHGAGASKGQPNRYGHGGQAVRRCSGDMGSIPSPGN